MGKLLTLALALVLVIGQAFALEHQLDLDAHNGGESCQVCLVSSGLDNAGVDVTPILAPAFSCVAALFALHQGLVTQTNFHAYSVRAPPSSHYFT
jgi:hypothetical protein